MATDEKSVAVLFVQELTAELMAAVPRIASRAAERLSDETARHQWLWGEAQTATQEERAALVLVQKERAREQAGLIEDRAERATVQQETVVERTALEVIKAEKQATERAHKAARDAYHAVPQ